MLFHTSQQALQHFTAYGLVYRLLILSKLNKVFLSCLTTLLGLNQCVCYSPENVVKLAAFLKQKKIWQGRTLMTGILLGRPAALSFLLTANEGSSHILLYMLPSIKESQNWFQRAMEGAPPASWSSRYRFHFWLFILLTRSCYSEWHENRACSAATAARWQRDELRWQPAHVGAREKERGSARETETC